MNPALDVESSPNLTRINQPSSDPTDMEELGGILDRSMDVGGAMDSVDTDDADIVGAVGAVGGDGGRTIDGVDVDELKAMIDKVTREDSLKTEKTIAKETDGSYSPSELAVISITMIIGLIATVLSMLTSFHYPIPALGVWNLVIGVFLMMYGALFLTNWKH